MNIISVLSFGGNLIQIRCCRHRHGSIFRLFFIDQSFLFFRCGVVLLVTSLLNLTAEVVNEEIRLLKLIEYFLGFVDFISVIDAAQLKSRSGVDANISANIFHGAGGVFPQAVAMNFVGWTQFYSHVFQIIINTVQNTCCFKYSMVICMYHKNVGILELEPIIIMAGKLDQKIVSIIFNCIIQMNNWNNLKEALNRLKSNPQFKSMFSSPVTKIVAANTAMFVFISQTQLLWRIKGVSQSFLVKHFSFDRFNIKQHRYYTMLTYAFSHFGFFHYLFDMIVIASFGRSIRLMYGNKVMWWLYLLGAVAGGLAMNFGMPNLPMVVPQVGADAPITSMITFYGLLNLRYNVLLFFFPVPLWALLALMGVYSLFQPTKKNLGGMFAGLIVYQLFKIRLI